MKYASAFSLVRIIASPSVCFASIAEAASSANTLFVSQTSSEIHYHSIRPVKHPAFPRMPCAEAISIQQMQSIFQLFWQVDVQLKFRFCLIIRLRFMFWNRSYHLLHFHWFFVLCRRIHCRHSGLHHSWSTTDWTPLVFPLLILRLVFKTWELVHQNHLSVYARSVSVLSPVFSNTNPVHVISS